MRLSFSNRRFSALAWQAAAIAAALALGGYLVSNAFGHLEESRIASGFGFLRREAGFAIGETTLIPYSPADSYLKALAVGVANTLRVALIGIIGATVLGTVIGLAKLSPNWLLRKLAGIYVEFVRNVPLLVQLFFWYALVTENLPGPRAALNPLPDVYLANRGVYFPLPVWNSAYAWMLGALLAGIAAATALARRAARRHAKTGRRTTVLPIVAACVLGAPALAYVAAGAPAAVDAPKLAGFNIVGGMALTPEFAALAAGLIVYTAAFVAEIVRGGIQGVDYGQFEAAYALGLRRPLALRFIVLPQALRIIVPPLASQYLNLVKNSSLAVAIGYPDLVSVANTSINQTGQAIEGIAIIMAVYLSISLSISAFMNWYNARMALKGR